MDVVFHVPEGERQSVEGAIANAENLLADESVDVEAVVLVANSDAVTHLVAGSDLADDLTVLMDRGVAVRACGNSLAGRDLSSAELLGGVEVVPSAVGELARLQADGYAYIRP